MEISLSLLSCIACYVSYYYLQCAEYTAFPTNHARIAGQALPMKTQGPCCNTVPGASVIEHQLGTASLCHKVRHKILKPLLFFKVQWLRPRLSKKTAFEFWRCMVPRFQLSLRGRNPSRNFRTISCEIFIGNFFRNFRFNMLDSQSRKRFQDFSRYFAENLPGVSLKNRAISTYR